MLDTVATALSARQHSETRVRQFVADASHELRTPLASIRGYAELTRRETEPSPDIAHALRRVESEAVRMSGLVDDLLLLARLDSGRPVDHRDVDLSGWSSTRRATRARLCRPSLGPRRSRRTGRRRRGRAASAPGRGEPARERPGATPAGTTVTTSLAVTTAASAHRRRRRARHTGRPAAGRLRPVRAWRPLALAGRRQHRPRTGHRRRGGPGPRRPSCCREPGATVFTVTLPSTADVQPSLMSAQRGRPQSGMPTTDDRSPTRPAAPARPDHRAPARLRAGDRGLPRPDRRCAPPPRQGDASAAAWRGPRPTRPGRGRPCSRCCC